LDYSGCPTLYGDVFVVIEAMNLKGLVVVGLVVDVDVTHLGNVKSTRR